MNIQFLVHEHLLGFFRIAKPIAGAYSKVRYSLPVLSNVLIRAEGSSVEFSVTDLKQTLSIRVGARVLQQGSITLPFEQLAKLLTPAKKSEIAPRCDMTVDTQTATARISIRHTSINQEQVMFLKGISADEYPPISAPDETYLMTPIYGHTPESLAIYHAFEAAEKVKPEDNLIGLFIEPATDGNGVVILTTDRSRTLSEHIPDTVWHLPGTRIPNDSAKTLAAVIKQHYTTPTKLRGERVESDIKFYYQPPQPAKNGYSNPPTNRFFMEIGGFLYGVQTIPFGDSLQGMMEKITKENTPYDGISFVVDELLVDDLQKVLKRHSKSVSIKFTITERATLLLESDETEWYVRSELSLPPETSSFPAFHGGGCESVLREIKSAGVFYLNKSAVNDAGVFTVSGSFVPHGKKARVFAGEGKL